MSWESCEKEKQQLSFDVLREKGSPWRDAEERGDVTKVRG